MLQFILGPFTYGNSQRTSNTGPPKEVLTDACTEAQAQTSMEAGFL